MMEELLNQEYEWNLSNHYSASKANIHVDREADGILKKGLFHM